MAVTCVMPLRRGSDWVGEFVVNGQMGGDVGTFTLTGNNGGTPLVEVTSNTPTPNGSTLTMAAVTAVSYKWTVTIVAEDIELVDKYRCQYHLTLTKTGGEQMEAGSGYVTVEQGAIV